jgi:hypothetical protein
VLAIPIVSFAGAAGCVMAGGDVQSLREGVVGGAPIDADPSVVLLIIPEGAGCTGVAISPRVVLTAKHCVEGTDASQWRVLVGYDPLPIEGREAEYTLAELRLVPGDHEVDRDLAIALLASDFTFPTRRYAFSLPPGATVGSVVSFEGYGNTAAGDGTTAGTRNGRSGTLAEVQAGALVASVGVCSGDSGGPLLDASGIVLGVAHDILSEDCQGTARFTRVDSWAEPIAQALRDTGGCAPTAWADACGNLVDDDCNGLIDDCQPPDADADADADADGDADGDAEADADSLPGDASETDDGEGEGCSCAMASVSGRSGRATWHRAVARLLPGP